MVNILNILSDKVKEMGRQEIEKYFEDVLNKFVDQFLVGKETDND